WMRHKVDHPGLFPLPLNPRLDQRLGKDAALEQKLVVGFQSIERLVQAARKRPDLAPLLKREAIQVDIVGPIPQRHRIEFSFDAVESSHQNGRKRQIGVARSVRRTDLETLRLDRKS